MTHSARDETPFIPVRACCGQRHLGVQCPDGLVMCCLCFDRVTVEGLSLTLDGDPIDVCIPCAVIEQRAGSTEYVIPPGILDADS